MQIQSISNDFDIQYRAEDIERIYEDKFDDLPAGMYLIKNGEGEYYYGKEFSYALFAAPFYKLFGNNGILLFNGLMFFMMILIGYFYLRNQNEEKIALSLSVLYFTLSTAFVYIFWVHVEIYNMFLVMTGFFLWKKYFDSGKSKYLFVAAFVFGLTFVAKVPGILLFLPFVFYELYSKRFKNLFLMLSIFLIPVVAIYGYFFLNTGIMSFYGGDRLYYIHAFPFAGGYDSMNEAGIPAFSVSENRLDALINTDNIKVIPYNIFYYIFGKFTGMLWYYPFTLFALISLFTAGSFITNIHSGLSPESSTKSGVNTRPEISIQSKVNTYMSQNVDRILILTGIFLYIVFFCTVIGNNYLGGQHAVGNRYFYVYPAFIYLIRKVDLKMLVPVVFIGLLTLNPVILDPIENSMNPSRYKSSFPYSHLPVEYSQLDNLPFWGSSHKIDDLIVYRLDDKSRYSGEALIINGSSNIIIRSENRIETLMVTISSGNKATDAHISIGKDSNSLELKENSETTLTIKDIKPAYADKRYHVYRMSVSSPEALAVTLKT